MSATQRQLLEERWKVLMSEPIRFAGESGISSGNSKRWRRINETLEDLATLLVDEVMEHEFDNPNQTGLQTVTEGIWQVIEDRLIAWAESVETAREARRAA